ncbi:NAD(P)-dependent oxidoreductase (plasmid) [Acidovorax sp. DW039]|nr:NAD(P)-dependent oxidoreductase [Acidovorax sp. DW039]
MAQRLLQAGYTVTVWNRSPAAAEALVALGARQALTPREAADGADAVIAMVRDDQASLYAWCDKDHGALLSMVPGTIAIDSSTLSLPTVRQLANACAAGGVPFLDAPVSGSRPAAEAGQLVYLVGGDEATFARAEPLLKTMGAAACHVGPVGHGALAKLVTNTLLGVHVTALAELIGMLRAQGAEPEAVLQAVAATPVWAPVDYYLSGSMLRAEFSPQFPIELMAKDFDYVVNAAGGIDRLPTAAAAREVFKLAIHAGMGQDNMTAAARLYENVPQQSASA